MRALPGLGNDPVQLLHLQRMPNNIPEALPRLLGPPPGFWLSLAASAPDLLPVGGSGGACEAACVGSWAVAGGAAGAASATGGGLLVGGGGGGTWRMESECSGSFNANTGGGGGAEGGMAQASTSAPGAGYPWGWEVEPPSVFPARGYQLFREPAAQA